MSSQLTRCVRARPCVTATPEEAIVFSTILSALLFSLVGGKLNDVAGRRNSIMSSAAVFTLGAVTLFCANNLTTLICGEVLLGIGIGIESLTSPLYISEVAKPNIRGMLVSAYAFMVCFGQFSGKPKQTLPDAAEIEQTLLFCRAPLTLVSSVFVLLVSRYCGWYRG